VAPPAGGSHPLLQNGDPFLIGWGHKVKPVPRVIRAEFAVFIRHHAPQIHKVALFACRNLADENVELLDPRVEVRKAPPRGQNRLEVKLRTRHSGPNRRHKVFVLALRKGEWLRGAEVVDADEQEHMGWTRL